MLVVNTHLLSVYRTHAPKDKHVGSSTQKSAVPSSLRTPPVSPSQPCEACLGVATLVFRRNRRVDEALKRLDVVEHREEEVAALTAANGSLLERATSAEVYLFPVFLVV